jgi:hypothetical protein
MSKTTQVRLQTFAAPAAVSNTAVHAAITWHVHIKRGKIYAHAHTGIAEEKVLMHRLIMNAPKGLQVDHRNNVGIDNRRSNLRLCNQTNNQANRFLDKDSTSGYKGVTLKKDKMRNKPWFAQINHEGRHYSIGYFFTKEEAAKAYNAKAKELFGDFARLNPI